MTYLEKAKLENPDMFTVLHDDDIIEGFCPHVFGYEHHHNCVGYFDHGCKDCWNREIPERSKV